MLTVGTHKVQLASLEYVLLKKHSSQTLQPAETV